MIKKNRKNNKYHIVEYKNKSIYILIKKNKFSRNYKLTFDKKNFLGLVSIPNYVSFNSGRAFAIDNLEWIYREMKMFLPLIYINHNTLINLKGKKMKIIYQDSINETVKLSNNEIVVSSKINNHKVVLKKWLEEKLIKNSVGIIKKYSNLLGVNIKQVKLTSSYNYWGSCNSNGIIHLNWRLIFTPSNILKYIIVHELCHLIEFNHDKNFWKLVKKFCPNYKVQIDWLKKNDNYLYRIRF